MNWYDFLIIGIVVVGALMGMKIGLIRAAFTMIGALVGWLLAGQLSDDIGELLGDSLSGDTIVTVLTYTIIVIGAVIVSQLAAKIVRPLLSIFTLGMSSMVDRLGGLALGLLVGLAVAGTVIVASARLAYDFDITKSGAGQLANLEAITRAVENTLVGTELTNQLSKLAEIRSSLEQPVSESQVEGLLNNMEDLASALKETEAGAQVAEQLAGDFQDVKMGVEEHAVEVKGALEDGMKESKIVSGFISITDAIPASALGLVPSDFKAALRILERATE